jgi:hypothetical protein
LDGSDEVRLGLAAFGDLGTLHDIAGRGEAFAGPEAKFEIERVGPGEIEAGRVKSFGAARDVTDGQARLLISHEARF